ncbi:sigma factor [Pedobacter sp. CAN_A7]|uniref:sigma factor n=1 Tax=Pedobacter sp. CAN_A7 TaxID=2787722 RepID=UPI0018C99EFA
MKDSPDFISEQSFKEAFKLYYPNLCFFAYQLLGDQDVAKDVVQDAYVSYWNQIRNIQDNEKVIKAYLFNSVKFIACNRIRHEKVVRRHYDTVFTRHTLRS